MKKIFTLVAIVTLLFLAGCTAGGKEEKPPSHGFWRSSDAGKTWEHLTDASKANWFPPISIRGFVTDPYIPRIVYALTDYGLWKTIDQGISWTQVNKGMRNKGEIAQLSALYINTQNTNQMLTAGLFQGEGKIFATDDGGATWKELYKELEKGITIVGVAVDPANENMMYAMGSDTGFKESFDGGKTWKKLRWLSDEIPALKKGKKARQFWANPASVNEMFVLTDVGIYRSVDRGATWVAKNNGIVTEKSRLGTETVVGINLLAFDTVHNTAYAASQEGIFESQDRGESWRDLTQFLPVRVPSIDALGFSTSNDQLLYFATEMVTTYWTKNKGQSWDSAAVKNAILPSTAPNKAGAIMIDREDPNIIYLGVIEKAKKKR